MNYVKVDDVCSRTYVSTSGVPAGSILGPSLFSIFTNDLVDIAMYAIILSFADDFQILMQMMNANDTSRLQEDVNRIIEWCAAMRSVPCSL